MHYFQPSAGLDRVHGRGPTAAEGCVAGGASALPREKTSKVFRPAGADGAGAGAGALAKGQAHPGCPPSGLRSKTVRHRQYRVFRCLHPRQRALHRPAGHPMHRWMERVEERRALMPRPYSAYRAFHEGSVYLVLQVACPHYSRTVLLISQMTRKVAFVWFDGQGFQGQTVSGFSRVE